MGTRVVATMKLRTMSAFDERVLAALREWAPRYPTPTYFVRNCMALNSSSGRYPVADVRAALRRLAKWGLAEQCPDGSPHLHWRAVPVGSGSAEPAVLGDVSRPPGARS